MSDQTFSKGERVLLLHTDDPHTRLVPGTRGTVTFVDDLGTIHTNWDDGSRLGMVPSLGDELRHLTDAELAEEKQAGVPLC